MKNSVLLLTLLLICTLLLGLSSCGPAQPVDTPAGDDPTQAPDETIRRAPDAISVYPFTQQELDAAQQVVEGIMDGLAGETGVLRYEVERVAYDPIMTDVHIRQRMAAPATPETDGWTEADYLARQISFVVTYSASYDHEKTFQSDAEHACIDVTLRRQDAQSPWEYVSHGVPVEENSPFAISAEELAECTGWDGRLLGGYEFADGTQWFYLWDETEASVAFVQTDRPAS